MVRRRIIEVSNLQQYVERIRTGTCHHPNGCEAFVVFTVSFSEVTVFSCEKHVASNREAVTNGYPHMARVERI